MFKNLSRITVLLVFIFCTVLLQIERAADAEEAAKKTAADAEEVAKKTAAETKDTEETETAGEVYGVPDNGVTIVLRAPTSITNYHVLKISKGPLGGINQEIMQGLRLSLPKNTTVRFIVDQVNTLFYDVRITVEKDGQQPETTSKEPDKFPIDEAREEIKKTQRVIKKSYVSKEAKGKIQKALDPLASYVENIGKLHIELNILLNSSQQPSFYSAPVNKFAQIKTKAKEKATELLKLKNGTSEQIRARADEAIKAARTVYEDKISVVPEHLPKDLSDTSNAIAVVFKQTATKLEEIEKAEWLQRDTEDRLLTDQIKYTCVFIPREKDAKLKDIPSLTVTVIQTTGLQGLKATAGLFVSELRDENYVMRANKITQGSMDRFSKTLGVLVHLPLYSRNFGQFRYALALTGGLPTQVSITDNSVSLGPGPVTAGVSFLFAGPDSESLISVTGGLMVKSVKRLKGYSVGDTYSSNQVQSPDNLTEKVNRLGVFGAITFSYDVFSLLHSNITETTEKE